MNLLLRFSCSFQLLIVCAPICVCIYLHAAKFVNGCWNELMLQSDGDYKSSMNSIQIVLVIMPVLVT